MTELMLEMEAIKRARERAYPKELGLERGLRLARWEAPADELAQRSRADIPPDPSSRALSL